ncbi:hypothetical protein P152DRAFT_410212 [Eremomyces bilateralis CBS 781.70]|uniref:SRP9 domain-containing protein n=1 Tax=Eremomyces bilateralis CBS 781.70 TaxID=1392243 RepID=A0A6G1GBJ5_9PEZI|nr:uncharacterized protein P152DRAFT_410212 [Eremomyces bilateralis CBS 781.70]KAF1815423.1 hypothetical protein P152DRAFT_410212 [Eremomyces bilateralis CBS 781.70]
MPTFSTSQEWLEQSALLIQAYPTSTHVASKYSVIRPSKSRLKKHARRLERLESKGNGASEGTAAEAVSSSNDPNPTKPTISEPQTTASFTLKTYSPDAGVSLKYTTNKAPEVGRLIAAAGRLGRHMAALPVEEEGEATKDAADGGDVGIEDVGGEPSAKRSGTAAQAQPEKKDTKAGGGGTGGGGKKKKKGKR